MTETKLQQDSPNFMIEVREFHKAYDGITGTEMLAEVDPDLVVLDLGLPRQNGFRFLQDLRMSSAGTDGPGWRT